MYAFTVQITLDICWAQFDAARAAAALLEPQNQERLICDLLMDQEILPGVGNIIKNEACFDAGVNPVSPVSVLTPAQVSHLVRMTRDFSLLFYKCRKTGQNLAKHYKIYRKASCGQCGARVVCCKPGTALH